MAETGTRAGDNALEEVVNRIVAAINPEQIVLFGSRARGDHGTSSDIDLLVVVDTTEDRVGSCADAAYTSLIGTGLPVDIVVRTRSFVDRFANLIGTVVRPALREGKVLYARP